MRGMVVMLGVVLVGGCAFSPVGVVRSSFVPEISVKPELDKWMASDVRAGLVGYNNAVLREYVQEGCVWLEECRESSARFESLSVERSPQDVHRVAECGEVPMALREQPVLDVTDDYKIVFKLPEGCNSGGSSL